MGNFKPSFVSGKKRLFILEVAKFLENPAVFIVNDKKITRTYRNLANWPQAVSPINVIKTINVILTDVEAIPFPTSSRFQLTDKFNFPASPFLTSSY